MALIKGFKGMRFNTSIAGDIKTLTCPPYDIISGSEYNQFLDKNKNNIIRLELPKEDNAYQLAGDTLNRWLEAGILRCDNKEQMYIYEEQFEIDDQIKKFKGFIALVKLEEFSKGVVVPHEETLSKAKTDRFNLMNATGCNFSPIYSLYMDQKQRIKEIIDQQSKNQPEVEFTDNQNVTHRLWCMDDLQAMSEIVGEFENKKLYIADGHHRYETAINYRNSLKDQGIVEDDVHNANYAMMMLVDIENQGLVVLPTHRIIRNLSGFDQNDVLEKCRKHFDIIEYYSSSTAELALEEKNKQGKTAFVFYAGDGLYNLLVYKGGDAMDRASPNSSDAYKGLDVSILHTLILEDIMGIDKQNMASQTNLTYTRSLQEAVDLVNIGKANAMFLLNPTKVTEIRDVAAAGEKMPQKSTYFYPKLITGLVMNKIM